MPFECRLLTSEVTFVGLVGRLLPSGNYEEAVIFDESYLASELIDGKVASDSADASGARGPPLSLCLGPIVERGSEGWIGLTVSELPPIPLVMTLMSIRP